MKHATNIKKKIFVVKPIFLKHVSYKIAYSESKKMMQHKTGSKDYLIDNDNCENVGNDSNPIIKPRRNSILIEPEDLDLYYKDGKLFRLIFLIKNFTKLGHFIVIVPTIIYYTI